MRYLEGTAGGRVGWVCETERTLPEDVAGKYEASVGDRTLTFWISAVQEAVSSQSELTREEFLYGTKMIVSIILSR